MQREPVSGKITPIMLIKCPGQSGVNQKGRSKCFARISDSKLRTFSENIMQVLLLMPKLTWTRNNTQFCTEKKPETQTQVWLETMKHFIFALPPQSQADWSVLFIRALRRPRIKLFSFLVSGPVSTRQQPWTTRRSQMWPCTGRPCTTRPTWRTCWPCPGTSTWWPSWARGSRKIR